MIEFNRTSALCVLGLLVVNPAFAAAQPGQRDLTTEVKAVFQAKCSECHGPQVPKPKGNFGYVLDLKKLAADPKKVVPSKPEESVLWQLVRDEMMPAEGAKAGPLTREQKETIRAWIEAGAPSTPIEPSAPPPAKKAAESTSVPAAN
jgi:mono/diheme cytochrome c family protein